MNKAVFDPIFIKGMDLDDTWFQLLYNLKHHGRQYYIDEGSYAGQYRLAFDFVSGVVQYPHQRPLAPRIPESSPLPPPATDEEIEQYFANYLMDSEIAVNEDYRYATWIVGGEYTLPKAKLLLEQTEVEISKTSPSMEYITRKFKTVTEQKIEVPNQVQWLIDHFKEKGHGNEHGFITIGYPESNFAYDIPYQNENERRTSPCLRGLDFRIIDGRLTTHVVYRSWDLVGGWPTNMGGFTLLNEYIAQEIGVDPGPLTFSCKSLHAYDHALNFLNQRVGG